LQPRDPSKSDLAGGPQEKRDAHPDLSGHLRDSTWDWRSWAIRADLPGQATTGSTLPPAARPERFAACALGKTVLLTTHYMEEAHRLTDRLAILRDGEIVATGAPAELLSTNGSVEITMGSEGCVTGLGMDEPNDAIVACLVAELSAVRCPCMEEETISYYFGIGNAGVCPP
jgi:hypothetical protein